MASQSPEDIPPPLPPTLDEEAYWIDLLGEANYFDILARKEEVLGGPNDYLPGPDNPELAPVFMEGPAGDDQRELYDFAYSPYRVELEEAEARTVEDALRSLCREQEVLAGQQALAMQWHRSRGELGAQTQWPLEVTGVLAVDLRSYAKGRVMAHVTRRGDNGEPVYQRMFFPAALPVIFRHAAAPTHWSDPGPGEEYITSTHLSLPPSCFNYDPEGGCYQFNPGNHVRLGAAGLALRVLDPARAYDEAVAENARRLSAADSQA